MTIAIEPQSLEQIEELKLERLKEMLLPEGQYDFIVDEATELQSKKGDPMIKLVLHVNFKNKKYVIFDYILCTNTWMFKLRAFCDSTNLMDMYDLGEISASRISKKKGKAYFSLENDKKYGWKCKVDEYIIQGEKEVSKENMQNTEIKDDDIPF
jgi:hypothetical protein